MFFVLAWEILNLNFNTPSRGCGDFEKHVGSRSACAIDKYIPRFDVEKYMGAHV